MCLEYLLLSTSILNLYVLRCLDISSLVSAIAFSSHSDHLHIKIAAAWFALQVLFYFATMASKMNDSNLNLFPALDEVSLRICLINELVALLQHSNTTFY